MNIKQNKWFRWLTNKYVLAGVPFAIWMTFFDTNSYLMQRRLQKDLDKLNESIDFYTRELERDRIELQELESNPEAFEKYAREKFWMQRPGEEVFVFETKTE
jgi:cell division protein FtsB